MAWASIGSLGNIDNKVDATTIVLTTAAVAAAGSAVVVRVGKDNIGASGDTTDIAVTDSVGNTYTRAIEQQQGGLANTGALVGIFTSVLATELPSGGTITATATSAVAKVISAHNFSLGAGSTISVAGSAGDGGANVDPGDITIGSLANVEYLWVHAYATEFANGTLTYTHDADYTALAADGTTGGLETSNISLRGSYRIFTGTTDTVNVTASQAVGREWRQVYVALLENAAGGGDLMGQILT